MNKDLQLTIASLLSILLFSFHLADDIRRGFEPGTLTNLNALIIFSVWLCGILLLRRKLLGYIIMLLGALLTTAVPFLHMRGKGVGITSNVGKYSGAIFFIWTLLALGISGSYSFILSIISLWNLRRRSVKT